MSDEVSSAPVEGLKSTAVPTAFKTEAAPVPQDADLAAPPVDDAEAEDTEESAPLESDDAEKPKKKPGINRRIGELTREKYTAQREADAQRQRADELERRLQAAEQGHAPDPKPAAPADKPTLAQFNYDMEAYTDAMADWKAEQRDKQTRVDAERKANLERQGEVQRKMTEFQALDPDGFQRAMAAPINYTPAMLEAVTDSDLMGELGVYLADHLDEADAISRMSPIAAAKAIGRLEDKLRAEKDKPAPPAPPKKTTTAPPPGKTLAGASSSKSVDDPGISPEQRIALWRAKRQSR